MKFVYLPIYYTIYIYIGKTYLYENFVYLYIYCSMMNQQCIWYMYYIWLNLLTRCSRCRLQ